MSTSKVAIGLQLYSVREDCKLDFPGTLKKVAAMGYAGVEFAGYYNYSAKDLRKMLDDLGLKAAGTHTGLHTMVGDELKRTIEYNQILGNKFLIVPGIEEKHRVDATAWKVLAAAFNDFSRKVRAAGMYTGYHNHHFEFEAMKGGTELPWDLFFGNTDADVVMQFDTGNALVAGAHAPTFLERYPGRALTVHLKEHSATNKDALIGEGDVKWAEIFQLCETTGKTQWYIVEQETYAYPPLECVKRCLEKLRAMGK